MITYDPRDKSWDTWCGLMAELFSAQQLGTVPEERWKDWADGMQGIGYFVNSGVPDSRMFDNWRPWAEQLVGIMTIRKHK